MTISSHDAITLAAYDGEEKILQTMSVGLLRYAVVGNVDAGKSTLIGTLMSSTLDDGQGANRATVFQHKHEVQTGRTSSISSHLMGFDEDGKVIATSASVRNKDESKVASLAHRAVSLMDLAGHEKYLPTTVAGLSRGVADYALVLVSATRSPTHMTMKHLAYCTSFGIPIIAVLTKSDACPGHVFRNTKKALQEALRSPQVGKRPYAVKNLDDVATVADKLHCLAPVIETSCVTGEGLDVLKSLLFSLPKRRQFHKKVDRPFELLIEDTFTVTGVGAVVSGLVNAGHYKKGDPLYLGPLSDGSFIKTQAKSLHVAQTNVTQCWAGHSACFALSLTKDQKKILNKRRGLVLLKAPVVASRSFTADVCLLKGQPATMRTGVYRTTLHILHLKRTAQLVSACVLDSSGDSPSLETLPVLRPGQTARVTFKFVNAEYIRKGMRVVFRDSHIRGAGIIVETTP